MHMLADDRSAKFLPRRASLSTSRTVLEINGNSRSLKYAICSLISCLLLANDCHLFPCQISAILRRILRLGQTDTTSPFGIFFFFKARCRLRTWHIDIETSKKTGSLHFGAYYYCVSNAAQPDTTMLSAGRSKVSRMRRNCRRCLQHSS